MNAAKSLVGLASAALLTGCGASMFDPATPGYDVQGCVEDAIRRRSDVELIREAQAKLERSCAKDDAAACSALGVIVESGALADADADAAERLFSRACTLGNERGCVNLGKLEERRGLGEEDASRIRGLYERACASGEQSGCAALGHALAHGGARERDRAVDLLGEACRAGRGEACFDLGELERKGSAPSRLALEHFAKACVAGHMVACSRLDPSAQVAAR